eukprot:TRINITY_DN1884_c0_g6_i2.p1 TRINITY_DN1884_c0_g6~~TRINITY_DN1884_c0_g6_i2.p1  ORF type:complete len:713 (+),score=129.49 TRINITY_DN1884_c0_g6_i2:51-2189(+)
MECVCPVHKQPFSLFCSAKGCGDPLICLRCVRGHDNGHLSDFFPIEDLIGGKNKSSLLESVDELISEAESAGKALERSSKEASRQADKIVDELKHAISKKLEARRKGLVASLLLKGGASLDPEIQALMQLKGSLKRTLSMPLSDAGLVELVAAHRTIVFELKEKVHSKLSALNGKMQKVESIDLPSNFYEELEIKLTRFLDSIDFRGRGSDEITQKGSQRQTPVHMAPPPPPPPPPTSHPSLRSPPDRVLRDHTNNYNDSYYEDYGHRSRKKSNYYDSQQHHHHHHQNHYGGYRGKETPSHRHDNYRSNGYQSGRKNESYRSVSKDFGGPAGVGYGKASVRKSLDFVRRMDFEEFGSSAEEEIRPVPAHLHGGYTTAQIQQSLERSIRKPNRNESAAKSGFALATGFELFSSARKGTSANGQASHKLHEIAIRSLLHLSKSNKFLSGSDDRLIKVWDSSLERNLTSLKGHVGGVVALSQIGDDENVASGDTSGLVIVWHRLSWPILRIQAHESDVTGIVYLNEEKTFATTGARDKVIKVWNPATGALATSLMGHTEVIATMAEMREKSLLVSVGVDGTLKQWNVKTATCLKTFDIGLGPLRSLAQIEGSVLIGGCADGSLRLIDVEDGKAESLTKVHTSAIIRVIYARPERRLITLDSNGRARRWGVDESRGLTPEKDTQEVGGNLTAFFVSRDGGRVFLGGSGGAVNIISL